MYELGFLFLVHYYTHRKGTIDVRVFFILVTLHVKRDAPFQVIPEKAYCATLKCRDRLYMIT